MGSTPLDSMEVSNNVHLPKQSQNCHVYYEMYIGNREFHLWLAINRYVNNISTIELAHFPRLERVCLPTHSLLFQNYFRIGIRH